MNDDNMNDDTRASLSEEGSTISEDAHIDENTLIEEVLDRIDEDSNVTDQVEDILIEALIGGSERSKRSSKGKRSSRASSKSQRQQRQASSLAGVNSSAEVKSLAELDRIYLKSVTVSGFRGIGPKCNMSFHPGPGLTLIIGRNGSGKSSFAEATEFALTGDSLRWAGKTIEWKEGWRNLHVDDVPEIVVNLHADGGGSRPFKVRTHWPPEDSTLDAAETSVSVFCPNRKSHRPIALGLDEELKTFRPFLSYNELSAIVGGRPIDRYNALAPMLGIESLRRPLEKLRRKRLDAQKTMEAAQKCVVDIVRLLRTCDDRRSVAAEQALIDDNKNSVTLDKLAKSRYQLKFIKGWELHTIEELINGTESAFTDLNNSLTDLTQLTSVNLDHVDKVSHDLSEAIKRMKTLSGSSAERAQTLAHLLESAVKMHSLNDDLDCPLCGREHGLSRDRMLKFHDEINRLRSEADDVISAREDLREARRLARQVIGMKPQILDSDHLVDGLKVFTCTDTSAYEVSDTSSHQTPDTSSHQTTDTSSHQTTDTSSHIFKLVTELIDAVISLQNHWTNWVDNAPWVDVLDNHIPTSVADTLNTQTNTDTHVPTHTAETADITTHTTTADTTIEDADLTRYLNLVSHMETACLPLVEATQTVNSLASNLQQHLADQWKPVARQLIKMHPIACSGQQAAQQFAHIKKAEQWLKKCEALIRQERFDVIKTQVLDVWNTLAVDSNVAITDVQLGAKKVDMHATVDGAHNTALGVMSQGELHALALSLFIPRVKLKGTPFGFVMLDDPVQAMDPVKVDSLAQVLNELAKTHQVVVFTHDDRLSASVRNMRIPCTMISVTRRANSCVDMKRYTDPVRAAIADARAVLLTGGIPDHVARRVIPGLCRQAIESACLESGRRKLLASGMNAEECEHVLQGAVKLLPRIALALYGDADKGNDVYRTLQNKYGGWAVNIVKECNSTTHSGISEGSDVKSFIRHCEALADHMLALT